MIVVRIPSPVLAMLWTGCTDAVPPEPKSPPLAAVVGAATTPVQVYGAWHCGNDFCTWATPRDLTEFDNMNHWLVDRGDADHRPSVNLVVLSLGSTRRTSRHRWVSASRSTTKRTASRTRPG